jgi:rhamnulokinase
MNRYLAFDLGAESGRAMLGVLQSGTLRLAEVCRFPNEAVLSHGSLQWDILRLWLEITRALAAVPGDRLESVGLDTWGCDFALLGEGRRLIENPYCYRDSRTDDVPPLVFERVSWDEIYSVTGIQFLKFNTLFQIYAACRTTPRLVDAATALVTIPDLLNFWLTGTLVSEYSNATTTQMVDARSRSWAVELLDRLGLPTRLLQPLVEPGAVIGTLDRPASAAFGGTPVVAPACHDTGSAVASVAAGGTTAFISSGTWSLLGMEVNAPVVTPRARDLNFTNEGSVCGTTRLLRNIGGLWPLQAVRREWTASGLKLEYEDLLTAAAGAPAFASLFDPDDARFFHPASRREAIAGFCGDTGQRAPKEPADYTCGILESLAFKYRVVLESLEELTGTRFTHIRIVGGGSRNRLRNQFTADATGRTVVAGPVEATALGNIAMQMLATGAVASIAEARQIIERSFPAARFEPADTDRWDREYARFRPYLGA